MPFVLGFALAALLLAILDFRRSPLTEDRDAWTHRATWRSYVPAIAVVLAANAPLYVRAAAFAGRGVGDARTHAMLARMLAESRVVHGWTDAYGAGFPVGPHYPTVGWALSALLVKAGLTPMGAVGAVGFLSVLAVPVLSVLLALRAGARPATALACALFLSWVSPSGYFVGGYEAFYGQGLLSQVLALPSVVLCAGALAARGAPWTMTVPAVIAVACHPQVAIAEAAALFAPVVASTDRRVFGGYARAVLAMGAVGLAIYGPGIATLGVPFGWPPMEAWKTVGFGPEHLGSWLLRGHLLDVERAPVLTATWEIALMIAVVLGRRPAARAAAAASIATVALSMSGALLGRMGAPGAFLLTFLQPLRIVSLLPLVAAANVLVSLEESAPFGREVARRLTRRLPDGLGRALYRPKAAATLALVALAGSAFPVRWSVALLIRDRVRAILAGFSPEAACGPAVAGAPPRAVKRWASTLVGGRLWYDDTSAAALECEFATGFEIDSSVPIAVTSGVGGHVGVHQVAFHQLAPLREGSALRAEALGVRHALLFGAEPTAPGWEIAQRSGDVVLAHRVGGTDVVGVGCIRSSWSGADARLRERLFAELLTKRGADKLLDPHAFVALDEGPGLVEERAEPEDECRFDDAEVREVPREPGAEEAFVETGSPVDIVLRVASFPTWRVLVDGRPAPVTNVAPGFPSVRVPPGRHHVEATVTPLRGYALGIALSLAGAALCSLPMLPFARSTKRRKLG